MLAMGQTMRSSILLLVSLVLIWGSRAAGEDVDWRTWTSTAGTKIEAKLVERTRDAVVLEQKSNGRRLTVKLSQLSQADLDFIGETPAEPEDPAEVGDTVVVGVDAKPGATSAEIVCVDDPKWTYYVYLPKTFHTAKKWPVWFIMSAGGGKGGGALNRYKEGADRLGCILALSVQSKNSFAESDRAMETMANDVYDRLPVIEGLGFSSGMSGGSRMAYLLAERDKRLAGVLACGSGSGVYLSEKDFRAAKLRKSTYVYSLIGTNCFNRDEAVRSHDKFPKNYRLRFFPGGHVWAESKFIAEGMARVYGETLKGTRVRNLDDHKRDYARTMWKWTGDLQKDEPWEAAYWAEFLADFDGDSEVSSDAKSLSSELEDNPQVDLAADAQKALDHFNKKHFNKPIDQAAGKRPVPARQAEADKLADKFGELPHAELLRKLGGPAS